MKKFLREHQLSLIFMALALMVALITGIQYVKFRYTEAIFVQGPGVTEMQKLSDYYAPLKGTIGDADIYVLGSQNPDEPSILLLGGTHPNEPSGQLAPLLLMENIELTNGTVYIILETNKSAYTYSFPQEATPEYYSIETPFGAREFKYGARATNAIDQWPIPDIYVHQSTGQKLSGIDTRNLNRAFPGKTNGTYTEKVAQAIVNLVNEKDIILTLDFHEAAPEYAVNNALIYHDRARDTNIPAIMRMNLESYWVEYDTRFAPIKLELSPVNLRGLTHRELGDNTLTLAFLAETSNASQGRIRGAMTEELIVGGYDKFYERATALGILEVDYTDPVSLDERVGRHVQTFLELISAYNLRQGSFSGTWEYYKRGQFVINYHDLAYSYYDNFFNERHNAFSNIMDNGIGHYLLDPNA